MRHSGMGGRLGRDTGGRQAGDSGKYFRKPEARFLPVGKGFTDTGQERTGQAQNILVPKAEQVLPD